MKKLLSYVTMAATILFFVALIITFLYPEVLMSLNMSQVEAKTVLMNLISLILVLTFMQTQLSVPWRVFCLISSFVVLIESILMLGSLQQLLK